MSARRVTVLLIAGILVIAGAIWVSSQRHLERATVEGEPVLQGMKSTVNDVTEIRLVKGDGTHATLRKRPSDWVVAERDYPADSGRVRKLLLDLGELQVVEEKTREPANYPQLGVEEVSSPKATGTRVEVVTPAKVFTLIAGKSSGNKSGYVRVGGAPQSLLATPQINLDADPKRWVERAIVDIPDSRIREVAVTAATGPSYTVAREKKEQSDFTVADVPKGRALSSPSAANPVAGGLASLTLDDVRRAPSAAAGAAAPAEHATFRTFDGLELQIDGRKDGDRRYIALTPRSTAKESAAAAQTLEAKLKGWEFEIPGYKYEALLRPLEELLQKKEEPKKKVETKKPAVNQTTPKSPAAKSPDAKP